MESPPTQELPPWYTLITSTATDAAGDPTATVTTLMRLPLTYYGPSIPLGTDTNIWVYGGPTSPSTASPLPVSPTPATSTNVTPTLPSTLTTPPSSTLPPTSSVSSSLSPSQTSSFPTTSTGLLPTGSSTQSSATSSSTLAGPTVAAGPSRLGRTAIGAIVGSIIAALIILLCCLLVLRWRRTTRRRRDGLDLLTPAPERHRHSRLYSFTDDSPRNQPVEPKGPREPIWTGWSMVHTSAENRSVPPVEGGWTLVHDNGSGDRIPGEGSPRGSGEETDPFLRASHSNQMSQQPSARLVTPAPVLDATHNSMDSTSTGASGYGIVVEPSQARFSHLVPPPVTQWGNILPPTLLTQMVDEPRRHDDIMEEDEEESLLEPPPRLDPDRLGTSRTTPRPSLQSLRTSRSERSLPPPGTPASWDETPQLMTAQRIRVDEMDRAEAREVPSPTTESPTLLGRLGRSEPRSRQSTPESRPATPHPEPEAEAGPSSRPIERPQRLRPVSGQSGTSGESGSTLFHDAPSRTETPPPLPSPPPALTTSSRSRLPASELIQESTSETPTLRVAGHDSPSRSQTDDADPFADTTSSTVVQDPLDSPAPVSRFVATSFEYDPTFPPGLVVSRSWMTSSGSGTLGDSDHSDSPPISMDIYEEAPPSVAERWRFITGSTGSGRSTQPPVLVHPRDISRSEAGSLHSMRSHLNPSSPRSVSGSAPASPFQYTPDSSQGSKSHGRSQGSRRSLVHQTSISSQGRRRRRPEIGESSLPSPYGRLSLGAIGTSAVRIDFGQPDTGPSVSLPATPFSAYFTTSGSVNSAGTNVTADVMDPVTGVAVRMPRMPAYTHDRENRHSYPYYPLGDE